MLESRVQTLVYPVTNLQESWAMSLIFASLWVFTVNHRERLSLEGAFDSCFIQPFLLRKGSTKAGCSGPGPMGFSVISKDTNLMIWWSTLTTCSHVTPAVQWKTPFSYIWIEFPVFKYLSSCCFPGQHWEAWLYLLCSHHHIVTHTQRTPWAVSSPGWAISTLSASPHMSQSRNKIRLLLSCMRSTACLRGLGLEAGIYTAEKGFTESSWHSEAGPKGKQVIFSREC